MMAKQLRLHSIRNYQVELRPIIRCNLLLDNRTNQDRGLQINQIQYQREILNHDFQCRNKVYKSTRVINI